MIELRITGTQKDIIKMVEHLKLAGLKVVDDNKMNYKNHNSELYRRYIKVEEIGNKIYRITENQRISLRMIVDGIELRMVWLLVNDALKDNYSSIYQNIDSLKNEIKDYTKAMKDNIENEDLNALWDNFILCNDAVNNFKNDSISSIKENDSKQSKLRIIEFITGVLQSELKKLQDYISDIENGN